MITNFNNTLIRCSAIGTIMTESKDRITDKQLKTLNDLQSRIQLTDKQKDELDRLLEKSEKTEELSESCKSFLVKTYAIEKYSRQRDVLTKEMEKGIFAEEDAITLYSLVEKHFFVKNTTMLSNSFIKGTPDLFKGENIYNANEIIDLKCSWDIETFLSNISSSINKRYYWQLQGYMALSGATKAHLVYCLVNTPDHLIGDEQRRLLYKMNVVTEENKDYKIAAARLEYAMQYDDIPYYERVLKFSIDRNEDDIQRIYKKVEKCRLYLSDFEEKHLSFTKAFRNLLIDEKF